MDKPIPKGIQKILSKNEESRAITNELLQKCEELNKIWNINSEIVSLRESYSARNANTFEISQRLHEFSIIKERLETDLVDLNK